MAEAARFAPDLAQHAVQRFQRERAAIATEVAIQNPRGIQIRRDEHRVPAHIHGGVYVRSLPRNTRGEHFLFRSGDRQARGGFIEAQRFRDVAYVARDPQNIFRRVVVHFAMRFHVKMQLGDPRFLGR